MSGAGPVALALLPATFFLASRLMDFPRRMAIAAAVLAPMAVAAPDAVAVHPLLWSLAAAWVAVRDLRWWPLPAALVALTAAVDPAYGFFAAVSIAWMAAVAPRSAGRVAWIVAAAAMLSAFVWIPLWMERASPLPALSPGHPFEIQPFLSLLAVAGAITAQRSRFALVSASPPRHAPETPPSLAAEVAISPAAGESSPAVETPPMAGAPGASEVAPMPEALDTEGAIPLVAGVPRPAFETPPLPEVPATEDAIPKAGGASSPASEASPMLAALTAEGARSLAARASEVAPMPAVLATEGAIPKAGGASSSTFEAPPMPAALTAEGAIPLVAGVPRPAALAAAAAAFWMLLLVGRTFWGPLFDIFGVSANGGVQSLCVLAAAPAIDWLWTRLHKRHIAAAVAAVLVVLFPIGREALHRWRHPRPVPQPAPAASRTFELVDVGAAVTTTRNSSGAINDRWSKSDWVARRVHLLLDWNGRAPADLPRVYPYNDLPQPPTEKPPPGMIRTQSGNRAEVEVTRPVYLLLRTEWRRDWRARVDGAPRPTVLLSPGVPAVELAPGNRVVEFRREPAASKPVLGVVGAVLAAILWSLRSWAQRIPWRRLATPAAVAAIALPVAIPLLTSSLITGHDAFFYFTRVVEVHENVRHGILFPRWAPDMHFGAGQPLFLFHPPMFYWLAEFWYLLGFPVVASVNLACAAVVFASAAGMFLLGRLYFGTSAGYIGAAAYVYAPYFATDLYIRSALEEFTAFAFVPLALFGFGAYAHRRNSRYLVLGAAAYACLILTHLPSTLLFTPVLLGFVAINARSWRAILVPAAGLLLALGLAACVWVPVLFERKFVSLERAAQGYGEYANHFVYWKQLLYSEWGYGYSVPGPGDGMPFAIGWNLLLAAAAGWLWAELRSRKHLRLLRLLAAASLILCLLMLPWSATVWQIVRPLQFVQLPWRILGPVTLCAALLAAALAPRRWWLAAALALLIAPNLSHLHPGSVQDIDPSFWTPREMALAGFETTVMSELTPRWMRSFPPFNPHASTVVRGEADVKELRRTPFYWSGEITAVQPAIIRMSYAYFPGWRVAIDGRTAEFAPSEPHGLIEFPVAAGTHRVEVAWGRSPARMAGDWISGLSIVLAIWFYRSR